MSIAPHLACLTRDPYLMLLCKIFNFARAKLKTDFPRFLGHVRQHLLYLRQGSSDQKDIVGVAEVGDEVFLREVIDLNPVLPLLPDPIQFRHEHLNHSVEDDRAHGVALLRPPLDLKGVAPYVRLHRRFLAVV
jgi:hypothetical protein